MKAPWATARHSGGARGIWTPWLAVLGPDDLICATKYDKGTNAPVSQWSTRVSTPVSTFDDSSHN